MKAMILAAGLGTRLKPLTDTRPKALVELSGRTLLEITLTRLRIFGVTEFIINVHHFADQVIAYLKSQKNFGLRIEISREEILLDTGGGVKKAARFFLEDLKDLDEPFLLHNVDVISAIDLRAMLQFHTEHHALATLAVQSRESSRQLLFNNDLQLCGRRIAGKDTLVPPPHHSAIPDPQNPVISSEGRALPLCAPSARRNLSSITLQPLAFSGIHVLSPRLLPLLTEDGIFSIIPSYLRLAAQGQKILAFRADQYYWRDLGRLSDLAQAALDLQQNVFRGSEL
ncbi:MAG TPA: nucleotidyltransferase family protein [Candidatus Cybelea sp.]|nr:nucleotidyltransferase family protein [Candidatus Cybelea sp.]